VKRKLRRETRNITNPSKYVTIGLLLEERYGNDPIGFFRDCIDFSGLRLDFLTHQQIEIAESLVKYGKVAVSSGTGIGKTAIAALLALWGVCCHYEAKVVLTGPCGDQVEDGLWSEVNKWINRFKYKSILNNKTRKIHIKGMKHWQLLVRTPPKISKGKEDELTGKIAGMHEQWMLIIIDEMSDVPDSVIIAFEGTLTEENNYLLGISNPGSVSGIFYDIITESDHRGYHYLKYSNLDSPLVREGFAEEIARDYGIESRVYKVKVLGEVCEDNKSRIVTPAEYDRIISSQRDYHQGRIVLGVDVGGVGEDSGVICHRIGDSVTRWDIYNSTDPTQLGMHVIDLIDRLYFDKQVYVVVDAIGEGSGTFSYLRQYCKNAIVIGHKGSEKALNTERFRLRRSEILYRLKEEFPNLHFPTPPPKELKKEVVNVYFTEDKKGLIEAVTKDELKRLIGWSPNCLDALSLTCAIDGATIYEKVYVPVEYVRPTIGYSDADHFGEFDKFLI